MNIYMNRTRLTRVSKLMFVNRVCEKFGECSRFKGEKVTLHYHKHLIGSLADSSKQHDNKSLSNI